MSHATIPNEDLTSMRRRIVSIFGSSIGNLIEWYDFYVYNFFALYFARSFFPNSNPTAQGSPHFGLGIDEEKESGGWWGARRAWPSAPARC
jgi:hypothetical protein